MRQQRRALLPTVLAASAVAVIGPELLGFVLGASRPVERPSLRAHSLVAVADGAAGAGPSAEEAKASLMDLLADSSLAEEVQKPEGKPVRGRVDEAILRLEALSPTAEPVYSEALDGTWNAMYTGSFAPGVVSTSPTRELALFLYGGGFSLGNVLTTLAGGFWGQNLGIKEGKRSVRIEGGRDVEATAEIEVAGQKQALSYTAELMPLSAQRMSEEIISVQLPVLGKQDAQIELRRSILITYLDDEVMVVRDENGVPEVLVKEIAEVEPLVPDKFSDVSSNVTEVGNSTAADPNATSSK